MEVCEKCFCHDHKLERFMIKIGKLELQLTLCRTCSIDMKSKYSLMTPVTDYYLRPQKFNKMQMPL